MGACRPPTSGQQAAAASQQQMAMAAAAAIRAQLMASSQAAAAEYQRQQQQLAMAMLNGDVNQAQAIRARLFQTQQQAALLASQHYAQQQQQMVGVLMHSVDYLVTATATANSTNALPSIISRLPPSANCISVEELERQFATN
ncbi:unnamed protein product [Anisakis simplex]|uniref:Uncharacterized protein n=1 Tax=Anisakis simplex TaxID=6269 RepID=A0A0M3KD84_ANISI|nr:unnamed protein product [Anisakis simplex]